MSSHPLAPTSHPLAPTSLSRNFWYIYSSLIEKIVRQEIFQYIYQSSMNLCLFVYVYLVVVELGSTWHSIHRCCEGSRRHFTVRKCSVLWGQESGAVSTGDGWWVVCECMYVCVCVCSKDIHEESWDIEKVLISLKNNSVTVVIIYGWLRYLV